MSININWKSRIRGESVYGVYQIMQTRADRFRVFFKPNDWAITELNEAENAIDARHVCEAHHVRFSSGKPS